MKILKLKIAVDEIDKERLFKGQKHTYLDATCFLEDEPDQYGNHGRITQDVTKEEREQGIKGPILGNAKVVWEGTPKGGQQQPARAETVATTGGTEDADDIPF